MWPLYLHMHVCAHVHACMHTHTQKLFVIFEEISENKYISLNNYIYVHIMRFPHGLAGKESTCNAGDLGSIPGLGKIHWRREMLPTPVFWPGEFHGLYSPWGCKELDVNG